MSNKFEITAFLLKRFCTKTSQYLCFTLNSKIIYILKQRNRKLPVALSFLTNFSTEKKANKMFGKFHLFLFLAYLKSGVWREI